MKNIFRVLISLCALFALTLMPLFAQDATPLPDSTTEVTAEVSTEPPVDGTSAAPGDAGGALIITAEPTATPTATLLPLIPLQAGSVEGSITDTAPLVRYTFVASRDEGVVISMETTSGNLDPVLALYTPDGELIASNDDQAPGQRNALLALTLPAAGIYVIEAGRFDGGEVKTSGTFRLTLTRSNEATDEPGDPLAQPPNFGVTYTQVAYQDVGTGRIEGDQPLYFAFAGEQGDLVRLILSRTSGDLLPSLNLYDSQRREIGRDAQTRETDAILYATLPETGWYLIEATRRGETGGTGTFDLFINRLANAVLQVGDLIRGGFSADVTVQSYIVNARLGDQISATMFTSDANSAVQPSLELLDLSLRTLDRATGDRFVTINADIPRSAPYILRVTNRAPGTVGGFSLRLSSVPTNPAEIETTPINYNDQTSGAITDENPLDLLRFNGKTGELVTITMRADNSSLDPYLILMDGDLNELAANDDSTASRDARIVQFRLPKDGDYVILASRSSITSGGSSGTYTLALTVGEIRLTSGAFAVTLTWESPADLNLFVRDPNDRTVTWSSPTTPSGGQLQIDSNTACQTPSDQPVEHIYWETAPPVGEYIIWAWNQNGCGQSVATAVTVTMSVNGTPLVINESLLNVGERLEMSARIAASGEGVIVNAGTISSPSPQQTASEGGDPVIRYNEALETDLTEDIYARFYQFSGTQGETIRITLETVSGTLDPVVLLRSADDRTLPDGTNDDSDANTRNSVLTYTLPYTGQYIIAATRFGGREGTTSGRFRLLVEPIN